MAVDLDPTDWRILEVLQEDARVTFAALGRDVGLSAPAVAERVRRLEAEAWSAATAPRSTSRRSACPSVR